MKLRIEDNFELYFKNGSDEWQKVWLKQCFPKTMPHNYLSVLNEDNEELILIKSLSSLSDETKDVISRYLKFKNFKIEIVEILGIEEEYGIRQWQVDTVQGARIFQTAVQDWPTKERGVIRIEDIHNDVYFADLDRLSKQSLKKLSFYVD